MPRQKRSRKPRRGAWILCTCASPECTVTSPVLLLGPIPNQPGHVAALRSAGHPYALVVLHADEIREATDDEI